MEMLVATIITAGAAIVAAIIGAVVISRRIDQELARHDDKSVAHKELLSKDHTQLSDRITQIGGGLSREHRALEKEISGGTQAMGGLAADLQFLRDEQVKVGERQQALTAQQLDIQHTSDHIMALVSELARLQSENQSLRQENNGLTQNNELLAKINLQLTTELERPPEQTRNEGSDWEPDF